MGILMSIAGRLLFTTSDTGIFTAEQDKAKLDRLDWDEIGHTY
jgi:hypothetical protein